MNKDRANGSIKEYALRYSFGGIYHQIFGAELL
jgi:hypothetical protein